METKKQPSQSMALITRATDIVNRLVESGGEVTTELEEIMQGLELDAGSYADRCKYVIDELDAYADKLAERVKQFQAAKKTLEAHRESLASRVKFVMQKLEKTEIAGSDYRAKVSQSAPRLVIDDATLVPEAFKIIVFELDKERIKQHLLAGQEVAGCHLETGLTLKWSVKK